ncbi:helix-turn-helix domain-containing protein [Comamonas sp. JNW]|uniref:helix-turn-helix domain-containing protein n=1 Tax=Comamonas sp. JNW TaxID=2170731 RepID=UPI000DE6DB57|nr:helix-turn-helix domain-containing protein [Comamonas sp. JNW]PWB21340.1 hypothetical protein DCO45_02785 [Comamonas sp. JNW]
MTESQFSVVPMEVVMDRRLTLEQTRVLIALFSFRNKVTNTVWPSRASIAARTGMHPSNISSATTALVGLGWVTKEGAGGHSKATRYTLNVPEFFEEEKVADQATVAESATVAQQATQTVAERATTPVADQATRKEQSIEQSIEQTKKTRKRASNFVVPDWIDQAHWDAWHSCAKRKNATDAQKQMAVEKLARWKADGIDYALALENAAIAGWQGLFEPKTGGNALIQPARRSTAGKPAENFDAKNYGSGVETI